jgi:predicted regulator of Ras-like GTPase activity (Roadblock/LC7/MglB family)
MEKKTCTLRIKSRGMEGYLYFKKGELIDSETGDLKGEDAAYDIVCWERPEIEIDPVCKKKKKNITATLNHILMEAFRIKDEKERGKDYVVDNFAGEGEFILDSSEQYNKPYLTEEEVMALEKHLQALKEIKGFKAAGIMNFTGEMLATESADPNVDLSLVGATFNDIFRSAHEASKKIGLDACRETVITTPKGVVVMRCSGVDSKSHFHLIGIMAADGNQALMKMQVEKMVPAVMDELA